MEELKSKERKILYVAPQTELVFAQPCGLMDPISWKGDSSSEDTSMPIYEEGDGGWDGDTKGAKDFWNGGGNNGMWDN